MLDINQDDDSTIMIDDFQITDLENAQYSHAIDATWRTCGNHL